MEPLQSFWRISSIKLYLYIPQLPSNPIPSYQENKNTRPQEDSMSIFRKVLFMRNQYWKQMPINNRMDR